MQDCDSMGPAVMKVGSESRMDEGSFGDGEKGQTKRRRETDTDKRSLSEPGLQFLFIFMGVNYQLTGLLGRSTGSVTSRCGGWVKRKK